MISTPLKLKDVREGASVPPRAYNNTMNDKLSLNWIESKNDIELECVVDLRIMPGNNKVLLTIPGVDGSVDGFENKYRDVAKQANQEHGYTTIQMSNPFISSFHWQSNIRQVLDYLHTNAKSLTGENENDLNVHVFAHSAGAATTLQLAWEYPTIKRILAVNPAAKLGIPHMEAGLRQFAGDKVVILVGSNDPSHTEVASMVKRINKSGTELIVREGADHYFSGEAFATFRDAPATHLFN